MGFLGWGVTGALGEGYQGYSELTTEECRGALSLETTCRGENWRPPSKG